MRLELELGFLLSTIATKHETERITPKKRIYERKIIPRLRISITPMISCAEGSLGILDFTERLVEILLDTFELSFQLMSELRVALVSLVSGLFR